MLSAGNVILYFVSCVDDQVLAFDGWMSSAFLAACQVAGVSKFMFQLQNEQECLKLWNSGNNDDIISASSGITENHLKHFSNNSFENGAMTFYKSYFKVWQIQ